MLVAMPHEETSGWRTLPWVDFGYPFVPALYVGVNALVFFYFTVDKSWEAVWSLGTIAAGWLSWRLRGGTSSGEENT